MRDPLLPSRASPQAHLEWLPAAGRSARYQVRRELQTVAKSAYRQGQRAVRARRARMPTVRFGGLSRAPGTVYVLTPDFDEPAGGVRVMYRHVDLLNEAGVSAAVLHGREAFRCSWFPSNTRIEYIARTTLSERDLLVVPEVFAPMLPDLPAGLRHVLLDQSGHLLLQRDGERISRHLQQNPDLLGAVAVSEHSQHMLQHAYPMLDVRRVHLSVDPSMFFVDSAVVRHGLLHLTRRGAADAEYVLQVLRARGVLAGTPVKRLDGVTQQELATALRSSSIFLHLPYREGFGLPAVEAMASGAYVVGYHGFGGAEFMLPAFSSAVPTGDLLALVVELERLLHLEREAPGWLAERGRRAAEYVARTYSVERERAGVVAVLEALTSDA